MDSIFKKFDDQFNSIFPFGNVFANPLSAEDTIKNLEEESFEVVKGNYKTKVTLKFNEQGWPVSYSYFSEYIPAQNEVEINQLLLEKMQAVKSQNFEKAAEIRDKLKQLNYKPTKTNNEGQ